MSTPPAASDFDVLVDDFLQQEFAAEPTTASALGVPGYDDRLPDRSASAYAQRARREDGWAARLGELADEALSPEQRIDRDLVASTLRGRQVMRSFQPWRRDPEVYTGAALTGVFTLFLHALRPEPELVASAAARLRAVPEILAQARANLDAELAHPVVVRRALGQARAAVGYTRDGIPALAADDEGRQALADAGAVASASYAELVPVLERLESEAHGDYAVGEARYSALLRDKEGLGYGAHELRRRGRAAYDELAADMAERAAALGAEDWRALLTELDHDHPATPENMRAEYEHWTQRAREFVYAQGLVSQPTGERCNVVPSPPFQRAVLAVAFYMSPPPFSDRRVGNFFVPTPPDEATPEQVAQRLSTNSFSSIPSIAVHEAYPGHHWHLSWLAHSGARPVRRVLRTPYFSEGWALYAEEMLKEQGFFTDPRQELRQVDARLFRAARIVVDTSLHLGEMSIDEAVEHMSTKASLSRGTAEAEVARYCAWPTQASAYLTGALEIARMRDEWVSVGGGLREFHDRLCATGALPIALAERALAGR